MNMRIFEGQEQEFGFCNILNFHFIMNRIKDGPPTSPAKHFQQCGYYSVW